MECKNNKEIESNTGKKQGKLIHKVIIIDVTAAVVISLGVTITFQYIGLRYVSKVRNGYLDKYQEITVGEAFKQFFEKPAWHHKKIAGEHIVTFTGKYTANGEEQNIKAFFKVDNDDNIFSIYELDINDVKQDDETTINCLNDIFKNVKTISKQ